MNRHLLAVALRIFVVLGSFVALGCESSSSADKKSGAEPRGPEKTEERAVEKFEGVFARGKVKVVVTKGPASAARLTGPDNYLKDVKLRIEQREVNGRDIAVLVAELKKAAKAPVPLIEMSVPTLVYVEADGPARASVGDFSSAEMVVVARDAARVDLDPAAYGKMSLSVEHAGRIYAPEVMAEVALAKALGEVALIQLGQVGQLKREAGGGKVSYKGNPELIK